MRVLMRLIVLVCLLLAPSLTSAQTLRADRFVLNTGPCSFLSGPAPPEGAANGVAGPCSWYYQTDSPFTTYRKMSGTGNTGWVALSTGGGSLTSVGLVLPSFITVSGSPVTGSSGTLTGTLATQTAAFGFFGPVSGSPAPPTFRALTLTDLPAWAPQSANLIFGGPTSGVAAIPAFRSLVNADLPVTDPPHGGTGLSTLTPNGVLFGNGTSNAGVTSAGGANSVLVANGGAPAFTPTPTVTNLTATGTVAAAILNASTSTTTVALTATGTTILDANAGTSDFASQTTGWRVTEPGAADFRNLFVDEMHAKLFVADLEQALAGGQIVSKGVAVLSSDFTCPAASGTSTLSVEDLPGAPDMQVFQANDFVVLRSFARAAGSLTIGDCVGVVTSPSTAGAGFQTWTFTRQSGGGGGGAIAFVNRAESTLPVGAQASAATAAASHTAGNLLVVGVTVNSATGITVTDTAGNTYTQAGSTVNQGGIRVSLWYAYNITGHASNVVTAALTSGSATYFNASVRQFSGALTTNPIDGTAGATGNSTSLSSGSVAVTASESVIVAMMEADGQSLVAGSGYTLTRFNGGTGDGGFFADEYKIVTASEAATATAATGGWGIAAAAFKVAPGGGGGCAGGMPTSTVVPAKGLALDYGVSGNGYYEVNAIDGAYGANSPYAQIVTWATCPISTNRTLRTRFGRLDGITSGSSEYGMIAGTYSGTAGQYFRASNLAFEVHGMDFLLFDGSTNTFKIDHAVPSLAIGSPVPSAFATGTGIWMGNDGGVYKARFGNPAGNRMTWDGTTLTLVGEGGGITNISGANIQTGSITLSQVNFVPVLGTNVVASINASAEGIQISGARIGINGSTTFSAGYDPSGKIATGGAAADVNGGSTVITGGLITVNSSSTFGSGYDPTGKVSAGGAAADINANVTTISGGKITTASVTATQIFVTELAALNATLGGWTMAADHLFNGSGAARVGLYVGGGTTIRIYAGSETAASAPFRVDASGALIATNVNITGAVNATSGSFTGTVTAALGTIGGWSISSDRIIKGPNAGDTCGLYSGAANNIRLFCGSETITDAPFRVDKFGALTASSGTVAGWVLAADHFYSGSGSERVGLYNGAGTTIRIYAGSESAASAPFRVDADGSFVATNATITGAINATSGSFTGNGAGVTNIDGGNIDADTITADKLDVSDLSAISANIGTITAGSISGITISGGSISQASGVVVVDSDGITMTAGSGTPNKIKWTDGSVIYSAANQLVLYGGSAGLNAVSAGDITVASSAILLLQGSTRVRVTNELLLDDLAGGGDGFACADNAGVLEKSASSCVDTMSPANLDFSGYVLGGSSAVIRMLGWAGGGDRFVCADNNGYLFVQDSVCN